MPSLSPQHKLPCAQNAKDVSFNVNAYKKINHDLLVRMPFLFHSRLTWHCKHCVLILSWKVLRLEMGDILQMVCLTFVRILWFLPPFLASSSPDFCGLCGSTENIPDHEQAYALYLTLHLVMSSVVPLCKLLIFLNYIRDCPSLCCK